MPYMHKRMAASRSNNFPRVCIVYPRTKTPGPRPLDNPYLSIFTKVQEEASPGNLKAHFITRAFRVVVSDASKMHFNHFLRDEMR